MSAFEIVGWFVGCGACWYSGYLIGTNRAKKRS